LDLPAAEKVFVIELHDSIFTALGCLVQIEAKRVEIIPIVATMLH
jgi:hypothetical protein